jgi:hypothetical protein
MLSQDNAGGKLGQKTQAWVAHLKKQKDGNTK